VAWLLVFWNSTASSFLLQDITGGVASRKIILTSSKSHYLQNSPENQGNKVLASDLNRISKFRDDATVATSGDVTLVPLSREPLLLQSSFPLLTHEECNILVAHFEKEPSFESTRLLHFVTQKIAELTLSPTHDGEPQCPRYITYEPRHWSLSSDSHPNDILPDGLHVDTNNGKLFRHITALLYLTSSESGATMFPLAVPMAPDLQGSDTHRSAIHASQTLLKNNIHHTLKEKDQVYSTTLLETARHVYHGNSTTTGIRILPQQGHVIVFFNLDRNGSTDPWSWHGGEFLRDQKKALLTFFKEIPLSTFRNQSELGQRAYEAKQRILKKYY